MKIYMVTSLNYTKVFSTEEKAKNFLKECWKLDQHLYENAYGHCLTTEEANKQVDETLRIEDYAYIEEFEVE